MKKKCLTCGMIRSSKDLVKLESGDYICFSCWNKRLTDKVNSQKN
ncbi:MAG TPA: hypothetical protein VMV43_05975 [Candidatus Nanopelagicaceae bacterium]|nr:hypothetical protein [Candidatus Nanopelagicaceae bacterium]